MYPMRQEQHTSGWFLLGAMMLSGIAGFTNSAALGLGGLAVSHLTGSLSRVSVELSEGDTRTMLPFTVILVAFFLGAVCSGAVVAAREVGIGRRYAALLALVAALLALAGVVSHTHTNTVSLGLTAFACGAQNTLATSYRGMLVRTTHMTGVVTDLGFEVGVWLRSRRVDLRVVRVHLPVLCAFFVGGVIGALVTARVGADALFVAAAGALGVSVSYLLLRSRGLV